MPDPTTELAALVADAIGLLTTLADHGRSATDSELTTLRRVVSRIRALKPSQPPDTAPVDDGWHTENPPAEQRYLITRKGKVAVEVTEAVWSCGSWSWYGSTDGQALAWRHLPEPYRPEEPVSGVTGERIEGGCKWSAENAVSAQPRRECWAVYAPLGTFTGALADPDSADRYRQGLPYPHMHTLHHMVELPPGAVVLTREQVKALRTIIDAARRVNHELSMLDENEDCPIDHSGLHDALLDHLWTAKRALGIEVDGG